MLGLGVLYCIWSAMLGLGDLCWVRGAVQDLGSRMLELCLQLPLAYPQLSSLAGEAEVFVL